jgi:3-oxoacyl-[acyl-carrier protein] reductase
MVVLKWRVSEMGNRLKGRVAAVTGSGQGIGRAIALALAKEGAKIVTNNRHKGAAKEDAETVAGEIIGMGGQAFPFFGDIGSFEIAGKLIQTAVDKFGRLDILINNAGTGNMAAKPWNMTEEDWDICLNAHLKGTFNCIRHACGIMKDRQWGRIINTSSMAWTGNPPHMNYGAAKAGIVGLTRAVAGEMYKYGVTCNAYCPNAATPSTSGDELKAVIRKAYQAGLLSKAKYEGMLNPPAAETIGPLIVYLCTEEAGNVNGKLFEIKGGEISIYAEPVKEKLIYKEQGLWTIEELINLVPTILLKSNENEELPKLPD